MKRNTLNTFITAALVMLVGVSSSAQAVVPANSKITSTSTLDVGGETPLERSVTVTVNLQRSQPEIALKASDQPNPSVATWIDKETQVLTYTYTITTTANGPATYTVNAATAAENLTKDPIVRINATRDANIDIGLGATAVSSIGGGRTVITVPSDGRFSGKDPSTTVNGIKAGTTVKINGQSYSVTEVVDDTGVDATITLGTVLPEGIERGTLIAEQAEFTVNLREVSLNTDVIDQTTVGLTVTATQGEGFEDLDADPNDQSFLVIAPRDPEMQFYVRNTGDTGNPEVTEENSVSYNELTYFETDLVNTNPGDTLEYLVTVRAGNEGPLTAEPYQRPETPFLEYVVGTTALNTASLADEAITEGVPLKHEGADEDANAIATDQTAYITYQMKVLGGEETVPGGDGGDIDLSTAEGIKLACNGTYPNLFTIERCQGQPWVAINGETPELNPVCWDRKQYGESWREDGVNPWVVGTAAEFNIEAYDCRTKCAGKSGESFAHCAADGWWDNDAATYTVCEWAEHDGYDLRCGAAGTRRIGIRGCERSRRAAACN